MYIVLYFSYNLSVDAFSTVQILRDLNSNNV